MAEIAGDLFGILAYDDKPMLMENLRQIYFSLCNLCCSYGEGLIVAIQGCDDGNKGNLRSKP
ncbi:hypothetical protein HanPI659440_Chr00c04g0712621 [Helianthus annuus]|nr:hypothetical protein HanPI659440_Chr00c04g0712621 [Helianthus annuus]